MTIDYLDSAECSRVNAKPRSQPEAWRAGHAAAMIANLHLAGNPERAEVWKAEQEVWLERCDAAVRSDPLRRQAEIAANETTELSFSLHLVAEL